MTEGWGDKPQDPAWYLVLPRHRGAWKLDFQGDRLRPANARVASTSDVLLEPKSKTLSTNGVIGGEKQENNDPKKVTDTGRW